MTHGAPAKRKKNAASKTAAAGADETAPPPPPDGGWGWAVVFGSFMIHVVADGITYSFGIFMLEFIRYYNVTDEAASWVLSILVGVTLGSGPLASSLVNKYGCRAVTIAGTLVAAVGLACSVVAPSIEVHYLTVGIITGFGFGLIYLPAIVSVTCYFEAKRSFATGIAVCGSGLGTFIFAPLIQLLVNNLGWKGALLVTAAITLHCIIFGALFRPLKAPKKKVLDAADAETAQAEANQPAEKEQLMASEAAEASLVADENAKNTSSTGGSSSALNGRQMTCSQPHLLQVPVDVATQGDDARQFGSHGNLPAKQSPRAISRHGSAEMGSRKSSGSDVSGAGLMYRKDILYNGSITNLPEYKENPQNFAGSMRRLPTIADSSDEGEAEEEALTGGKVCGCVSVGPEMYHAYKEMMDFSLFKDPVFVLFTVSNFCTSIGFNVPYVFMKDKGLNAGLDNDTASFLLAVIGIANTVGRIILGYVSDKPWINRLWLYNTALTVCGLATGLSSFCYNNATLQVYASVFGVTAGAYVGLTSVVLVDLLGLEKLTNAFGLLLLFQGVASLIGPPIAGRLVTVGEDGIKNFDAGFWVAGFMIAISGLMLFFIPLVQRCAARRQRRGARVPTCPHDADDADAKEMTVIASA